MMGPRTLQIGRKSIERGLHEVTQRLKAAQVVSQAWGCWRWKEAFGGLGSDHLTPQYLGGGGHSWAPTALQAIPPLSLLPSKPPPAPIHPFWEVPRPAFVHRCAQKEMNGAGAADGALKTVAIGTVPLSIGSGLHLQSLLPSFMVYPLHYLC